MMVKSVIGEVTTYYVNAGYEKKVQGDDQVVRPHSHTPLGGANFAKYYSAGGTRIAMRENEVLTWLLSDHLGSTSVTADAAGNLVSTVKYTAFGEIRSGASGTDYQYTGQRNETEVGLYYYVARFYDPMLGRFVQADTVVQDISDLQSLDRFAYSHNNPINFIDPTGHAFIDDDRTSCQTAACRQSSYYWEKPKEEEYEAKKRSVQKAIEKGSGTLEPNLLPDTLLAPEYGAEGLDYGFFADKKEPYTPPLSNIEYSKMIYDTGAEFNWWKPIPLLSEVMTASIQLEKDKDKGYSFETEVSRVGLVVIEDAIISGLALEAAAVTTALTIPTGFASVVIGASVYWDVSLVLSAPMDNINEHYLFPYLNIE